MKSIIVISIISLFVSLAPAKYSGGTGELNDPYQIATAEDLILLGESPGDYDKHFIQRADIDLDPNLLGRKIFDKAVIAPDTNEAKSNFQGTPFTGIFDGNGYTISHLTLKGVDYLGLFGYLSSWGKIIELGVVDVNITGSDYVGGLVGWHDGKTMGSYSTGIVSGSEQIGGLIGHNHNSHVIQCYSTCEVNGIEAVGGLTGLNYEITLISESYTAGHVNGEVGVGGLVGISDAIQRWDGGIIINCYSSSTVSGEIKVGGLVGSIIGPVDPFFFQGVKPPIPTEITNCYSTGVVSGSKYVGGLVGSGDNIINSCFWDIETSGFSESSEGGTGKTTAEMQTASTFLIWDGCAVWTIDDGNDYPKLWWENKPGEVIETIRAIDVLMGTGTEDDPFLIYTSEELNMLGLLRCDWDKHFKLMADIDLSVYTGTDFNIIGDLESPFTGVFDGNGHTISHFNYTSTNIDCIGLFGYVYPEWGHQAKVRDLGLINPNIDAGTGNYVGPLIGMLNGGSINRCYVEGGNITGNESVGGLVGTHNYTFGYGSIEFPPYTISNSYSTCSVEGNRNVGGLVGSNTGQITNCYAMGSVSGKEIVGGLIGQNVSRLSDPWWPDPDGIKNILYCYSTGHVSGQSDTGGLIGLNADEIIIDNSFWDMQTSKQAISAGGIDKFTADMQTADTFLEVGWDFIDEIENGTEDTWWILDDQHYPRLWWQYGQAFSPYPQDGTADVPQPLILSWFPGGSSLYHDVYYGEDKEAVADGTIENSNIYRGRQEPEMTTYNPGNLELVKKYYWRIDEVDEADPSSLYTGRVWFFTTANFIVVDDFESYGTYGNEIWRSWLDGLGYGPPLDGYPGNGTGSAVGFEFEWPYPTIVHSGEQAMPFNYDNNKPGYLKYSEVEKTLSYPRDWTEQGIGILSLWFRGNPANDPEPMYVAIANSTGEPAIMYHDDLDAAGIDTWTEWSIPLQTFADQGIDLTDVNSIANGFGDRNNPKPGGRGLMYFDDIRLYRPRPEQE